MYTCVLPFTTRESFSFLSPLTTRDPFLYFSVFLCHEEVKRVHFSYNLCLYLEVQEVPFRTMVFIVFFMKDNIEYRGFVKYLN